MRADANNSCRNSPFEEASRRWCARLEVDTPLYHGFRRNNTPEHAKRLIPRCVTSTPSLACERCVLQWNARRKDLFWQLWELGATVAEILLHPKARPSGVVKTIHVIRAVEYNDATMDQLPSDSCKMSVGSSLESEAESELEYETEWEPTTPMATEVPIQV